MPSTSTQSHAIIKPGGALHSLALDFFAETSVESWMTFLQELGLNDNTERTPHRVRFAALPSKLERMDYYIHGNVHFHTTKKAHWQIRLEAIPNANPPGDLKKDSAAVGGFDKFFSTFTGKWPSSRKLQAEVKAGYYLLTKRWKSKILSTKIANKTIKNNGIAWKIVPRSLDFDIVQPTDAIKSVRHGLVNKDLFELQATRELEIQLDQNLLNCEDSIWLELRQLIQEIPPAKLA